MDINCWLFNKGNTYPEHQFSKKLREWGINPEPLGDAVPGKLGICIFGSVDADLLNFLEIRSLNGQNRIIAIDNAMADHNAGYAWQLLQSGASDVLICSDPECLAQQVRARFDRWLAIDGLVDSPIVRESIVGNSHVWQTMLREIVEVARFSEAPVLILGESGTGKELIARLIHALDSRGKRDFVILDCSTIVPELSGSEFFGHERGAFTGAVSERDGAFSLANEGTLFLDEVGELPLSLQAQLLRVIQEKTYKRVGGNTWRKTEFRLVCATNRDLSELVERGGFRADLYYRIANSTFRLPPLRDRLDDVLLLAEFFLRQFFQAGEAPRFEETVREYLLRRSYPGNVRELRQVVSRLLCRYPGDGTITAGCIPPEERPVAEIDNQVLGGVEFERVIHRAVMFGVGLKDIGRAAEEAAIRIATEQESGNIQRAARRLGVTDRTLQIRRSNRRQ